MYHSGNQMLDPHMLFTRTRLRPGMHVADLGCGRTGQFVFAAAREIGEGGIVYAVDIMEDILQNIEKRAAYNAQLHVQTIWSDLERVGAAAIPDKSLDVALLINTLVQGKDRHAMLAEGARMLKSKARMLVVDWTRTGLPFGPADEQYVDFADIRKWALEHDFVVQEEFEAGPYHHGMVLFKHE